MNHEVGFVVLHYQTIEDTIACVASITLKAHESPIVIVDNYSPNGTGRQLEELYWDQQNIEVLKLNENLGFARGLNAGIDVIRSIYAVKYVVLLNNDTELVTEDFNQNLVKIFGMVPYAVMGPKIITLDNSIDSNPAGWIIANRKEIILLLLKRVVKYVLAYIGLSSLFHTAGHGKHCPEKINHALEQTNVKLHGSCLILSPAYFECFDGLCPDTFLYFEEDILYWQLRMNNLVSYYNPSLVIKHKEDSATNSISNSNRKKNMFVFSNEIKSLLVLYRMMKTRYLG